ncbi:flavin monoamine oxidase family protein [Streptosporangiaceae bacterium NEAU-GS5]|nr:flavin monoamine oxidase family protein [Streptosporangiaceae bacterium NEAU-GS5]
MNADRTNADKKLTRRALLVGVGVAGGAGAMYAAMGALGLAPSQQQKDFAPPQRSDFALTGRAAAKVVILGAGVAGLASAYELGKAGYDCTVLEASDHVGGRNRTLRAGDRLTELDGETQVATFSEGTYFNAGPARIAQWMVTLDYCRELRVPVELFVNNNSNAYVFNSGMLAPVRFRTARADMYGYVAELLAKATASGALDKRLTSGDKANLLDFLGQFGAIGSDGSYTGSPRRGFQVYPATGPGTPLSGPPPMSDVLGYGLGRALSFDLDYEQAMPMFQPVGGMDKIVEALAREVGDDRIRMGAKVTKITNLPDGVEVAYTGGSIKADYCVAALPPHLLVKIPCNLDPKVRAALAIPVPASAGKLGLEYRRRWWELEDRIYGGITETDLDLQRLWYPSYGFHGTHGLMLGYYNIGSDADTYAKLTHGRRLARALEQGERIHGPKYRQDLTASVSVAWRRQPHIEGAWAGWRNYDANFELLRHPAGRVYFAGDWMSYLVAWQAGAFESARAAVTQLHQRVLKGT